MLPQHSLLSYESSHKLKPLHYTYYYLLLLQSAASHWGVTSREGIIQGSELIKDETAQIIEPFSGGHYSRKLNLCGGNQFTEEGIEWTAATYTGIDGTLALYTQTDSSESADWVVQGNTTLTHACIYYILRGGQFNYQYWGITGI